VIAFLISGAFHEFAHAWSAYQLGDATAEREGRLTVNPLPHIDPVGLIFLVLMTMSGFGIGWMKPVPVNVYNLRHPKRDIMLVSIAGPAMNILIAGLFSLIVHFAPRQFILENPIGELIGIFLFLNILLAAFNLLPIYPLDGWKVVLGLLPPEQERWWEGTSRYGLILFFIAYITGILGLMMMPIAKLIATVLGLPGLF
jgi:Zn-dependent protease